MSTALRIKCSESVSSSVIQLASCYVSPSARYGRN